MKILEHSDGGKARVEQWNEILNYRFCWLWIAEVKHSLRRSPYECSRTWWWGQRPSRAVRRDRPRAVVGLASPKPSQTTGTKVISLNKCIWTQLLIPTVCPRSIVVTQFIYRNLLYKLSHYFLDMQYMQNVFLVISWVSGCNGQWQPYGQTALSTNI